MWHHPKENLLLLCGPGPPPCYTSAHLGAGQTQKPSAPFAAGGPRQQGDTDGSELIFEKQTH